MSGTPGGKGYMNVSLHIGMIASCTKCSCCPKYRIKLNPKTEKSNVQFESQTAKTRNCGKQARGVGTNLEEELDSSRPAPSPRPSWGGTPSLPWRAKAPPPIKGGAGLLLETHKFPHLISGLEPFGLELLIALACGLEPSNWFRAF